MYPRETVVQLISKAIAAWADVEPDHGQSWEQVESELDHFASEFVKEYDESIEDGRLDPASSTII